MRKRCHRRDGWHGECALVRDVWLPTAKYGRTRGGCVGERVYQYYYNYSMGLRWGFAKPSS
jgi:hypothetical protein